MSKQDAKDDLRKCIYNAKKLLKSINSRQLMSPVEDKFHIRNQVDNLQTPLTQRTFNKMNIDIKSVIASAASDQDENLDDKSITPKSLTPIDGQELTSNYTDALSRIDFISTTEQKLQVVETNDSELEKNSINVFTRNEICNTVIDLVNALKSASEEIKQLKFKNTLAKSQEVESKNNFSSELILQKQQFDKINSQLNNENSLYLDAIKLKDNKVKKYKNRILSKNQEINKLRRLLNDHSICINNGTISSQSPDSSATSVKKLQSKNSTLHSITHHDKDAPDMLNALGLLASHVLNEKLDLEKDNANINSQNIKDHEVPSHTEQAKVAPLMAENKNNYSDNDETRYSDNEESMNAEQTISNDTHDNSACTESENIFRSGKHIVKNQPLPNAQELYLPKLKSFSTVDGSVRDI